MRDFTPRPYQTLGMQFILERERCALWAGMGMGKTTTTLNVLDVLHNLVGESAPSLVLAPLRVARDTWPNEAKKWRHLSGLEISPVVGDVDDRKAALRRDVPVFTMNYDNLPWLVDHFGKHWPFRTIVADEATRLKSFRLRQGGKRAAALGQVAHKLCTRFVELTGTPSPNGLADLWGQIWMLDAGERLGRTFDAFRQRWFQKSFDGYGMEPLPFAQQQVQEKLRDICLTLDPKDWFDLRDPIRTTVYVDLPKHARVKYREMEREMFTSIDAHDIEALNAAAKTMKCLQLANGAFYGDEERYGKGAWFSTHDAKLEALDSIVEEAGGMPVLVAYHFVSDRERILREFPKAVDLADAQGMATFRAGKAPIGIAHPASLGHGTDGLQDVTNLLAFYGHWWDVEQRMQMVERIGPVRQMQSGHDRPVYIYDIVARDTVDELVLARHETKRGVQDLLLEAMKQKGLR